MRAQITPARQAAFEVLLRIETESAYASNLLASDRYSHLQRDDRALLQELVLGVLRWQGQLDFLIELYSRRKLSSLDTAVVLALRLGIYQLRFLERIPAHAAINESVNLVRRRKLVSAAPFVNAVLRNAQRGLSKSVVELIPETTDAVQRLSVETSHPAWLLERWIARYGELEARALALSANETPRVALRFNAKQPAEEATRAWLALHGVTVRDSTIVPDAVVIESGHLAPDSEPVRKGWVYQQDESSQLVARLAVDSRLASSERASSPISALDLCAAPGSKTTLIASLLPDRALVIAADLHDHRLRTMMTLARRLGIEHIRPIQLDATRPLPFAEPGRFDLVLLDAPCSGLGTLQRHPEIKWRSTLEKIVELAALQRELIDAAARQVRAGGLLTYSVCSTEPEEGEEIVAWLKTRNPQFRDVTRERLLELGNDATELLTSGNGARSFTHRTGTESFFFCVLWKRK